MQTTKMKIITLDCPKCKTDLTAKDAINYVRTGVQKNSMTYNFQHNWFDTEEYEFDSDGIFEEYTCAKCDVIFQQSLKTIFERLSLPPIQTWGKPQGFNKNNYIRQNNMTYLQNSKLTIKDSKDVAKVFLDLLALEVKIDQDKEHFYVMHLDVKSRITLVELVSLGTLNASLVHPREIFRRAVIAGSASIIVAHNHPSGEVEPSDEDTKTTKLLFEAGNILGITLLNHIIFTNEKLFSFRENREEKIEKTDAVEKGETYE